MINSVSDWRKLRELKIPKSGARHKVKAILGYKGKDFKPRKDLEEIDPNFYPAVELEDKIYALPLQLAKWAYQNKDTHKLPGNVFFLWHQGRLGAVFTEDLNG